MMARKTIRKNMAYDDSKHLYYVYFDYGMKRDGHRDRRAKTYTKREEAEAALLEFETSRAIGDLPAPNRITVENWLIYWVEEVIAPNRAYTTYYSYRSIIKNHIVPLLGGIRLQQLEPRQIQQYYNRKIRDSGLDSNSVHKHHILLHTALKLAFRQGLLQENPVDRVEAPRLHAGQQVYYTPEQLKKLFEKVEGTWLELVVKLGAYLGLRRAEICGLRWENIDFRKKVIYINITRTTAGNRIVEKEPKSDNSVRVLGIGGLKELIDLLKATRKEQQRRKREMGAQYIDSGYVITRDNGAARHPNTITWGLADLVRKEGLPHITVHGLRHTFASVANNAKVPLVDIGKTLGHKDVSITGRIYTHIFDQTHQEVLNTVAQKIQSGLR